MSALDFTQPIVGGIGDFYAWLADRLSDDAARSEVLIDLGLPATLAVGQPLPQHQIKGINEYRKTINVETEVSTAAAHDLGKALGLSSSKSAKLVLPQKNLANIRAYEKAAAPSFDDFKKVLGDLKELFTAVSNFVRALDIEGIHNLGELTHRVLDLLLIDYLRLHYPLVYWIAQPIGFLEEPISQLDPPKVVDLPRLAWDRLVSIRDWFPQLWVLDNEVQARQFSDRFFLPLASGLVVLGFLSKSKSVDRQDDGDLSSIEIEPHYGWDGAPGSATPLADQISERTLSLRVTWREESSEPPRKIVERHTTVTLLFVPSMDGGPGLLVSFEGGTSADIPLGKHWRLKFDADLTGAADFFIHLNAFFDKSVAIGPAEGSHPSFKVAFERGTAEDPLYRLGKEDGSHLQFGRVGIELEISPELAGVRTFTRESELVLDLDKSGDGFLSRILPGEKKIPLNLGLGYSVQRGFFIEGGKGNVLRQTAPPPPPSPSLLPRDARDASATGNGTGNAADLNRVTPVGKSFGPVRVQFLSLGLTPTAGNGQARMALAATISADVKLGPVTASLDKAGFAVTADFARPDANLGFFDLDFGFQPPKGIGLDIDAKVVRGGGFLGLDAALGQYSGALHLEIEGLASLSALGLLNTRIPGGGFSLLVIITADGFRPIPIGFGFMLAGIGGLLGIHRTVNEDAVQSGIRANTLGAVLAPKDLVRNAPQYLSTLGSFFPVAADHHLFGPVVQLTWGTPALITINLALIFEFGVRTRFLLMGRLIAILPRKEIDLVRLQMNIFGGIDFDQERAFLDAVLFDSRLVNRFVITGEMRLRMSWGDRPFFALAIGGLHPAFTPPAGMENMQRAAIVFADSDNLKIRCDAYWAITSNTVQFGAHAELFARKSKFSVSGHAGYDVLIQFDPFHFIASMSASLQLRAGSKSLFKVSFSGELSGPRPLHVKGKASFEIWWMDFTVSFSTTLVSGEKPPLPAPVDVGALLRTALADSSSWTAALPGSGERLVSLREGASGALRIHPLSSVSVKQNVTPLNTVITKFGHTRPAGGPQAFRVLQITIGTASFVPEVVREHFAPSQFRDMADDVRLSSPSFELLPAGVNVAAHGADCGLPVPAAADFEDIVIPSPPAAPRPTSTVPIAVANRFAEWSAVGLSDLSRLGANRYRAMAIRIAVKEKTFTVSSKVDLAAASPTSTFATRIEAADALGAMDPVRRATFQLVASRGQ